MAEGWRSAEAEEAAPADELEGSEAELKRIAENVILLERIDWGANLNYPRLGGPEDPRGPYALVPRSERVYNIVHHTVGIDNDATVNVWESIAEIVAMMRRLQLIRPDLGADVPYNLVLFLAFIDGKHQLVICEGRGYDRSGAHTAGVAPGRTDPYRWFNVCGVATSFAGNFEDYRLDLNPWMPLINLYFGHLRIELPRLGTATVCGRQTCGHSNFAPYSSLNATACCGQWLYARLGEFRLNAPPKDAELLSYVPALA